MLTGIKGLLTLIITEQPSFYNCGDHTHFRKVCPYLELDRAMEGFF